MNISEVWRRFSRITDLMGIYSLPYVKELLGHCQKLVSKVIYHSFPGSLGESKMEPSVVSPSHLAGILEYFPSFTKIFSNYGFDGHIQAVRKFPATICVTGSWDQTKSKICWKYWPNLNHVSAMTRTNQPIIVLCVNFCRTTYLNRSTFAAWL